MSCPAVWTPFFTTDQKGSLAWPWLTTMMRLSWACAGIAAVKASAAAAASPVKNDLITFLPNRALSEHRAQDDQAESRTRRCRATKVAGGSS